jgi:hypothetical protein
MTVKKIHLFSAALLCGLSFVFTDCKKKEDPAPTPTEEPATVNAKSTQAGKDSRDVQSENDQSINEINQVMSENPRVSGRPAGDAQARPAGAICGMTIDSLQSVNGVLKLNFNGTTCDNRTRTGSIRLTLQNFSTGTRWKDIGAVIKVEYLAYKITRASDQASMLLNGTQFLTNVSGGNWWTLLVVQTQTALVTTVTGTNLNVTFQDNTTAIYNINRKITYSLSGAIISVKGEGIGANGTLTDLENFGLTRNGDAFTSRVTTPIIWNTTCGAGAPMQGQIDMVVASQNFGLTFIYGVDVNGNPVTVGPNQCPFGWKLQWTVNSTTSSNINKYF